jgi:hypothetical protein
MRSASKAMPRFLAVVLATLTSVGLVSACSHHSDPPAGPVDPATLGAPPSGQGFQMKTLAFNVPAGNEEQDCYFFKVKDLAAANGMAPDQPAYLHRVQVAQKIGSHHMNLFRVKTIKGLDPANGAVQTGTNGAGECFKSPNWSDWPLVANTQQKGEVDWTYPDGVASEFLPDEWLMLQTHYVNASSQNTPDGTGMVAVNFWTMPVDQVKAQLGTIFATKQSIRVCEHNPTPSFEGSCQVQSPTPVTIIGANAHFHSRGKQFDIFSWDGTSTTTPPDSARFYRSEAWDDPPMAHSPELNVVVPANGGIWYSCSYEWTKPLDSVGCDGLNAFDQAKYGTTPDKQDCCYTFGPIVEQNEHCNAFVYYYPKQDNVTCF